MITIDQTSNLLNIAVLGEFSLADFQLFEEHARQKLKEPAPVNLLDLAPDARWQSDNQTVRFGQPAGDPERGGWADFASNVTLEDGQPYSSVLYTVPTTNTAGYIQGEFTIPQVKQYLKDRGVAVRT